MIRFLIRQSYDGQATQILDWILNPRIILHDTQQVQKLPSTRSGDDTPHTPLFLISYFLFPQPEVAL